MANVSELEEQLITQSALFQDLTGEQVREVIAAAEFRKFAKGEVLFHQADRADSTYLVLNGRIKLNQVTADGNQTLIRVVMPGQILAIVSAVHEGAYPATAVAERESSLLSWSGKVLDRLFFRVPGLSRNALAILSARILEMQERFGELAAERTERRLARAILRLADQVGQKDHGTVVLDLALSRQDLAEMIGTTLFSVSRILSDWQAKSWVKIGRQKVAILNLKALGKVADEEELRH